MDLFNIDDFMPHGHCYLWRKDILLLNVTSDIIIALCYLGIPILLSIILYRRKDLPFKGTVSVFIIFIFFCSLTHIMEIINVWYPYYVLTGYIKAATAIVSVISTYIILKNLNKILSLPSLKNLEQRVFNDMHDVIQKLPIGVLFSDESGKINFHNEYISNLFGYDDGELIEQEVEILIDDSLKEKHYDLKTDFFKNPEEKMMGGGRVLSAKTKEGNTKYLEVGLRPLSLSTSKKDLLLIAIKDITEDEKIKLKIAETLHLIHVATYGMPSLLSYLNKDGYYEFVNDAYTRKWDIKEENILKRHYRDFLPKETIEQIDQKMQQALSGEELNFKVTVTFPQEGSRELDVFYISHKNEEGSPEGVVVLAHDITDINKTNKELEQSNKQLEEYAFLVSHDLRAPVRHIGNFIELLEAQLEKDQVDKDKINKYSNIIKANADKVQNMISGMLKIASLNQMKPNAEIIEWDEFSKVLSIRYKRSAKITFKHKTGLEIESDIDLLDAVFSNLISNSISFSSKNNASIHIRIEKTLNSYNITYKDIGKGIDEYTAKSIFTPFIKSPDSSGLGLGMTIVSRSIERLGGEIHCHPSNKGAHFEIKLPTL